MRIREETGELLRLDEFKGCVMPNEAEDLPSDHDGKEKREQRPFNRQEEKMSMLPDTTKQKRGKSYRRDRMERILTGSAYNLRNAVGMPQSPSSRRYRAASAPA